MVTYPKNGPKFRAKYSAHRPCNRLTHVCRWTMNISVFAGTQFPWCDRDMTLTWEIPNDFIEGRPWPELERFMDNLEKGLQLVMAGAERMAWETTRADVVRHGTDQIAHLWTEGRKLAGLALDDD